MTSTSCRCDLRSTFAGGISFTCSVPDRRDTISAADSVSSSGRSDTTISRPPSSRRFSPRPDDAFLAGWITPAIWKSPEAWSRRSPTPANGVNVTDLYIDLHAAIAAEPDAAHRPKHEPGRLVPARVEIPMGRHSIHPVPMQPYANRHGSSATARAPRAAARARARRQEAVRRPSSAWKVDSSTNIRRSFPTSRVAASPGRTMRPHSPMRRLTALPCCSGLRRVIVEGVVNTIISEVLAVLRQGRLVGLDAGVDAIVDQHSPRTSGALIFATSSAFG